MVQVAPRESSARESSAGGAGIAAVDAHLAAAELVARVGGTLARTAPEPMGETQVTGLLRISEPRGGFLRSNDPAGGRWYSRDVAAIAAAHGIAADAVAPYFIDAEAEPGIPRALGGAPAWPAPGLTVIAFHNSHLVYALTWYGLALMVAAGAVFVWRDERRRRGGDNARHADGQPHAAPASHRDADRG